MAHVNMMLFSMVFARELQAKRAAGVKRRQDASEGREDSRCRSSGEAWATYVPGFFSQEVSERRTDGTDAEGYRGIRGVREASWCQERTRRAAY